jgi:hypothetical protein
MVYVFALVFRMVMGPDPSEPDSADASSRQLTQRAFSGAWRIWRAAFRRGLKADEFDPMAVHDINFPFNFNSIPESMSTLLVSGAMVEGIDKVILLVCGYETGTTFMNVVMTILFLLFVVMANLTILNMLIGVLCEVIAGVGSYEKEKSMVEFAKAELQTHYSACDLDENEMLDIKEFGNLLADRDVRRVMEGLEIDPYMIEDMTTVIFHEDSKYVRKTKGMLDFSGFLEVILEFRASQLARVTDLVEIRRVMSEENEVIRARIRTLKSSLADLDRLVDMLLHAYGITSAG